ncbi:MAG: leucine-rich repeat domain-containing protein [Roseburia sp.]|nr:leucine-rich repeat domain-containing protein [Roseburia sp.]
MQRCSKRHANISRKASAFVAVSSALLLCSCGSVGTLTDSSSAPVFGVGEKSLARISVADGYQKTSYVVGESFDPSRMYLTLIYTDGSENSVAVSDDMIVGDFDTSDFTVEVTPPVYDYEPWVGEPTSRQVNLYFSNPDCDELRLQRRLHKKGEPLSEAEIPTPHAPSADVYFEGWYFDPECKRPIDYVTKISEDTMFYANWLEIDYSKEEAACVSRSVTLCYAGEYTEFAYKVYKDIGEWYFDFEMENKHLSIGDEVDLTYEVGDVFSTRGLFMTGVASDGSILWGMPINKGMAVEFDTGTPGNRTVKIEFAGREFIYPITVTEKSLITSEGVTVSDNGRLLNLSGSSGRYALPENTYNIPNGFASELSATVRNNVREIVCPSSVTRIGDGAFRGMSRLESVTVGEGCLYIGDNAFGGCTNLKELYIYAKEPPYIMNSHFLFDVGSDVKIYVPSELLDAYVTSPYWCNYGKCIYSIDM